MLKRHTNCSCNSFLRKSSALETYKHNRDLVISISQQWLSMAFSWKLWSSSEMAHKTIFCLHWKSFLSLLFFSLVFNDDDSPRSVKLPSDSKRKLKSWFFLHFREQLQFCLGFFYSKTFYFVRLQSQVSSRWLSLNSSCSSFNRSLMTSTRISPTTKHISFNWKQFYFWNVFARFDFNILRGKFVFLCSVVRLKLSTRWFVIS